jgi:N-acetylglucosamine-6-sulfatase
MRRQGRRIPRRVTAFPRRIVIPLFTALGVIGGLAVAGSGAPPASLGQAAAAQARPNIVVIETDDQTLESMRVMDSVNSLIGGSHGATFENSFVNYALCCPSRATFLTGQYMHNHRVFGNKWPSGGFSRFQELHGNYHLGVWLRNAGYYTAMIGKYLNEYANDPLMPPGWSEWHAAAEGYGVYNYPLNNNGTIVNYGQDPADFKQDVLTRKAVNFVDRRAPKAQPFFLWLTYTAPHWSPPDPNPNPPYDCYHAAKPAPRHADVFNSEPLPRPPNFDEANVSDKPAQIRNRPRLSVNSISTIRAGYRCELESLLSVDEGVDAVVRKLKAKAELSNTVLIYTSDNGYFHGEHRIPKDKQHIYEESIRVPLLMRGPGIPRGVKVSDFAINADLAPTIVDLANANPGRAMDGRSLIPVARNPGIEQGRQLLIEEPSFKAIRTERYMYAEHSTGEKELYDLRNDPFELVSRHNAPAYASVRAQLAARLQELKSCAGLSCRTHP